MLKGGAAGLMMQGEKSLYIVVGGKVQHRQKFNIIITNIAIFCQIIVSLQPNSKCPKA